MIPELPNELRAEIFKHIDLQTAVQLLQIGRKKDAELIQKFTKFDVSITVEYVIDGFIIIKLADLETESNPVLTWHIDNDQTHGVKVHQYDANGELLYHVTNEKVQFSNAVAGIVRRIFSKPMFHVKKLYISLPQYSEEEVLFGRIDDELVQILKTLNESLGIQPFFVEFCGGQPDDFEECEVITVLRIAPYTTGTIHYPKKEKMHSK